MAISNNFNMEIIKSLSFEGHFESQSINLASWNSNIDADADTNAKDQCDLDRQSICAVMAELNSGRDLSKVKYQSHVKQRSKYIDDEKSVTPTNARKANYELIDFVFIHFLKELHLRLVRLRFHLYTTLDCKFFRSISNYEQC